MEKKNVILLFFIPYIYLYYQDILQYVVNVRGTQLTKQYQYFPLKIKKLNGFAVVTT